MGDSKDVFQVKLHAARVVVVRWVVVRQVRAELFDRAEFDVADDRISLLVKFTAIENACDQIVRSSMQNFQVQLKILHAPM